MEATIKISKSWHTKKGVRSSEMEGKVKDLNKYLQNCINSASMLQEINGGTVKIDKTENRMYINYLDVKNTDKIDTAIEWEITK